MSRVVEVSGEALTPATFSVDLADELGADNSRGPFLAWLVAWVDVDPLATGSVVCSVDWTDANSAPNGQQLSVSLSDAADSFKAFGPYVVFRDTDSSAFQASFVLLPGADVQGAQLNYVASVLVP